MTDQPTPEQLDPALGATAALAGDSFLEFIRACHQTAVEGMPLGNEEYWRGYRDALGMVISIRTRPSLHQTPTPRL